MQRGAGTRRRGFAWKLPPLPCAAAVSRADYLPVTGTGFTKPAGTGSVTVVTGLTGPDWFRPVLNRPKFKF